MGPLSMPEMLVVLVIAVMLFGKRLPDVGKSLGRSLVEFKKGLRGIQDELRTVSSITSETHHDTYRAPEPPPADTAVPKFEPPPAFEPDAELQPHQD